MKKLLILTAIVGLVALVAEGSGFLSADNAAPDKVSRATAPEVVIGMQTDDGSFYVVHLELADKAVPAAASLNWSIIKQLPDTTTLILLGIGGLFYRRKKE